MASLEQVINTIMATIECDESLFNHWSLNSINVQYSFE